MPKLSWKKKKENAEIIYQRLEKVHYQQDMTLQFSNAWELLVGGVLGAQATDEQVNKVTEVLFVKYPTIADFAEVPVEVMMTEIKSIGLFRNKAKSLVGAAKKIMQDFNGEVPVEREDLMSLPGVGPKVASLVRGDFFEIPAIVVDTHCGRITRLLGLTETDNPVQIEKDLMRILSEEYWIEWGHHMVRLGRSYCKARCRSCISCPLQDVCQYAQGKKVQKKIQEKLNSGEEVGCF